MTKRIGAALAALALALAGIVSYGSPALASPFNGAGYYYASASQTISGDSDSNGTQDYAVGLGANFLISKPYVPTTLYNGHRDHSLASITVMDTGPAYSEAVEVGWDVDYDAFGDSEPHLFACAFTGGGISGNNCWSGGTNYHDNGGNATNLGAALTSDIGTAKAISVYYSAGSCGAASSGWFIYYNSVNVGCYDPSAFAAGFDKARFFGAQGEYWYNGANNPGTSNDRPCGDSGNGNVPAAGAAYIASLSLVSPSPSTIATSFTLHTPTDTNVVNSAWTSGTTTRSFYFGERGYTSGGGTPGNKGSC